jgi:arylsulfatase A
MDKTHVWEGGIRVPQIARWPGVVAADSTCAVPTCTIDLYPTFAEISGGKLPANQVIDGVSIVRLLCGQGALARDTLFWHYPADTAPWPDRAGGAVRRGDLKLVEMYFDGRVGLFNLKQDPGERHNLAMQMPDKAAELYQLLVRWRHEVTGQAPRDSQGSTTSPRP